MSWLFAHDGGRRSRHPGRADPAVAGHNGRIVILIGDGTLVEFMSAVDAAVCALAIHDGAGVGNGAAGPAVVLRIGIDLGDVVDNGDDIYGDGVGAAARLEPIAGPGGICIASAVNEDTASNGVIR
jgi:adenylate cyclase